MQVTQPGVTGSLEVRLHPKALLWDSRQSVRQPSTSEPKYQDHAAGRPCRRDTPGSPVNP